MNWANVLFLFEDVSVALGGSEVHLHSATGFFRAIFADGAINGPMLAKSSFGHTGHFVGAAADFTQWSGNGFEDHDR